MWQFMSVKSAQFFLTYLSCFYPNKIHQCFHGDFQLKERHFQCFLYYWICTRKPSTLHFQGHLLVSSGWWWCVEGLLLSFFSCWLYCKKKKKIVKTRRVSNPRQGNRCELEQRSAWMLGSPCIQFKKVKSIFQRTYIFEGKYPESALAQSRWWQKHNLQRLPA